MTYMLLLNCALKLVEEILLIVSVIAGFFNTCINFNYMPVINRNSSQRM